ncbi:hypothetical protein CHARACLAT_031480 [Characodon lateralis]|uniref:Uncharacterized protein n=1 Tax=Characodon lateralis TaxID=208331 RepID=A0ABU7D6F5_9TELE|nr:hypothetical protein [Characodon lateralis]
MKPDNRGGGAAEVMGQHGIIEFNHFEALSVSEGCVLVVCPDFCTTCDLDLHPGLRHHQHLLGVKCELEGGL